MAQELKSEQIHGFVELLHLYPIYCIVLVSLGSSVSNSFACAYANKAFITSQVVMKAQSDEMAALSCFSADDPFTVNNFWFSFVASFLCLL